MKPSTMLVAAVVLAGLSHAPVAMALPSTDLADDADSAGYSERGMIGGGGTGGWNGGGGMPSVGADPVPVGPRPGNIGGSTPSAGGRPPYPGHNGSVTPKPTHGGNAGRPSSGRPPYPGDQAQ